QSPADLIAVTDPTLPQPPAGDEEEWFFREAAPEPLPDKTDVLPVLFQDESLDSGIVPALPLGGEVSELSGNAAGTIGAAPPFDWLSADLAASTALAAQILGSAETLSAHAPAPPVEVEPAGLP